MSRPLTPLGLTVLRLLDDEPLHPYAMQQRIRMNAYDQVVRVTHGALYHTVERLAATGLIEPVQTVRAGRRPERTVYAITDAGRDAAHSQLSERLMRPADEWPAFSMALAFASMLPPAEVAELLSRRAVALEAWLAAHDTVIDELVKRDLDRIHMVELEYALAQRRAEIHYVRGLRDDIESGRMSWGRPRGGDESD